MLMDSILFYGDRGDASRRQVRSAAAQHSHRIGPRKPKTSKRPRSEAPLPRKRPLKANNIIAFTPADIEARTKQRPAAASSSPPISANATASTPSTSQSTPTSNAVTPHQETESRRQQRTQLRWKQVQGIEQGQQGPQLLQQPASEVPNNPGPSSPSRQPPPSAQASLPPRGAPPLVIERLPPASESTGSHSRQSSAASSASPSTRLPQYSWTEYPRYGLSFSGLQSSLQLLAHAAVGEQEVPDQRPDQAPATSAPTPAGQPGVHIPGFRQYAAEPRMMETRQLPDPGSGSHARDSFASFLRSGASGQGYLEDRRRSSRSERQWSEIKREGFPEG